MKNAFLVISFLFLHASFVFGFGDKDSTDANPHPNINQSDSIHLSLNQVSRPEWHEMFTRIPGDWLRYFNITFTKDNIPSIAAMSALTAVLIVTDEGSWRGTKKIYDNSKFGQDASDFVVYLGDGKFQFFVAGAFAAGGFLFNDSRALRTASQCVETIFACGTVVQVLKHITGRESPFVSTEPGGAWRFFPNQIDYHKKVPHYDAFPSGHIATFTATWVVVAENYPELPWIKYVGWTMTGLISVGLVDTSIHWWSDIPLGIALGYAFGQIAAHPENIFSNNEKSGSKLSVLPMIGTTNGISISYKF